MGRLGRWIQATNGSLPPAQEVWLAAGGDIEAGDYVRLDKKGRAIARKRQSANVIGVALSGSLGRGWGVNVRLF